jgi:hypothetical protein
MHALVQKLQHHLCAGRVTPCSPCSPCFCRRGQAIIGTNNLVHGFGELGNLNIPYEGAFPNPPLPSADPLKVNLTGLRNGNGLSGVERGCLCEASLTDGVLALPATTQRHSHFLTAAA